MTKAGRKEFQKRMKERLVREEGMKKEWRDMKDRIKKALEGIEEKRKVKMGWWNEECRGSKKRVKRELRRWRTEKGGGERHREERKRHNEMCIERKRKNRKVGKGDKRGKDGIWKIINTGRKWRKKMNEEIGIKGWDKHFKRLLGGLGERVVRGEKRVRRERDKEREIGRVELRKGMRSRKERKVAERDGKSGEG